MPKQLPVIAAIPNFNMAESLGELLPQLADQEYADIFVLDDASTDGSREVVEAFGNDVHFIASQENMGAGAARNLIIGKLGRKSIIHFLDADVDLLSTDVPELANDLLPSEPVGFIGGLALTRNGIQNSWNYGPRQSLRSDAGAIIQAILEPRYIDDPAKAAKTRLRFASLLEDWPNPLIDPVRRQVFWNIEQNLLISSDVFEAVGGFDENLREHEIQDLAIRMANMGLKRYFDPSLVTSHKEVNVRGYNRRSAQLRSEVQINRRFGLRNWLLPDGKFKADL